MRFIRSFTLKEICLRVIIDNLDEYIYNKVRCIPQRHMDFLFRLYSKECFHEYTESHTKTEECLLWFLSCHNRDVYLSNITQNIMVKLQIVGSAITSLTLKETMATESMLNAVIMLVPHLSYLDLSSTNCSDNTLLLINRMCPDLITLNVQECENVTDDGMLKLCGSNLSLKYLNILYTSVEYGGLSDILKGMPSLQCLTYDNMADSLYYLHEDDIRYYIQKNIKYNLTELIYEDEGMINNPEEVIWGWTVLCPNVEKVHILFPVSYNVLLMCSRFPYLKELKLKMKNYDIDDIIADIPDQLIPFLSIPDSINIPDPLIPFISIADNLSTLILSYVKIPSAILIEHFKNVKNLYLKNVNFTEYSEGDIKSKDTKLDILSIKDVQFETISVYKFISLLISLSKNVTKLVIKNIRYLPNELVDVILNSMKRLTFVKFSFIRTELPSSFCRFFDIPSMQRVYLDGCFAQFTSSVHVARKSNTLSWCTMCDDDDDDDNEDFESDA